MTDLGKGKSGPKESDNRDKSLHGLMVALAMAGAIAGSAILFAYASSEVPASASADEIAAEPEIVEKVIEKPVYIERIKYVNRTVEVEKPVYINRTVEVERPVYVNRTVEVEKEVPVYVEKEKIVYVYVNETNDDSKDREDNQKDEDRPKSEQDSFSDRVKDLLEVVTYADDGHGIKDDDDDSNDYDSKRDKEHKGGDDKEKDDDDDEDEDDEDDD